MQIRYSAAPIWMHQRKKQVGAAPHEEYQYAVFPIRSENEQEQTSLKKQSAFCTSPLYAEVPLGMVW